jgi:hypothetical protein
LWSSAILPGEHAGVSFRSKGDPILFINNPGRESCRTVRRKTLDGIKHDQPLTYRAGRRSGDAHPHRSSTNGLPHAGERAGADRSLRRAEPTYNLYGEEAKKPGSFANSVLMARRLVERGVRFVQIYHNNWDHHGNLAGRMPSSAATSTRPAPA